MVKRVKYLQANYQNAILECKNLGMTLVNAETPEENKCILSMLDLDGNS